MTLPPFHWWRTVFYLIPAITLYTIVLGVVSLTSSLIDRRGHFAHRCARVWSWLILRTTRVTVRMHGALPSEAGGSCVFVSNHQSNYDIPVLFATLPVQLRIIAKAALGPFPFVGWHLRRTGHLLVARETAGPSVFRKMRRMVSHGASLIVFPEGSRSRNGQVGSFRAGVFLLAVDHGLPIVPISLKGVRHVMPRGRLMTCPGTVDVIVHPPVSTEGLTRADVRALAIRVRDIVAGAAD